MNAATITGGEVLMALLLMAIPLIAIGTLVWRQADRTRGLQASIENAAASSEGVKRIEAGVSAMHDELHRDYVRHDALREVEGRMTNRMADVEHVVRNTATTIISALSGAEMMVPRRRRPAP